MSGSSIDELMWLIADDGDPGAVEAFIKRHPEHRAELIRRVNMVRNLKGTKPAETKIPSFEMRSSMPSGLPTNSAPFWKSGSFAVMMACVLVAAFAVTKIATTPLVEPKGLDTVPIPVATDTKIGGPESGSGYVPPTVNDPVAPGTPNPAPIPAPRNEKYVAFDSGDYRLYEILNAITAQSGAKLELGPGLPNPNVTLDKIALTPKQMLEYLGGRVGFTVFEQGPNDFLIIPAVDPNATPTPVYDGGTDPDVVVPDLPKRTEEENTDKTEVAPGTLPAPK
jgi:hypothetical protein